MDRLLRKNKPAQRHDWTNTGSFINRPAQGWLHPDEQLVPSAGICYGVRYVGSMQVLESMKALDFDMRTMITKESIHRVCCAVGLKTSGKRSKKSAKIDQYLAEEPNLTHACKDVNMTITTESVTIVDMDNCDLIAHHLMPTISFASGGDQDTMDFVAFVAKDELAGRACHVIECGGGLAQDVITTIGQAFELRFKSYLAQRVTPINVPTRMDPVREEDYYNDRPDAVPPSPPSSAQAFTPPLRPPSPHYQSPTSNKPIALNTGEPCLISFEDANGATGGSFSDTTPLFGTDPRAVSYATAQKRNGELDSFDMKPFNNILQSSGGAGGTGTSSPKVSGLAMRYNSLPHAEPWFHGRITRQKCEELLLHDGDFLVRESPSTPGQFVLSGRHRGHIRHLLLVDPEGKVRTKDQLFNSVSHLVDYHMINSVPIVSADSELILETPVTRGMREM